MNLSKAWEQIQAFYRLSQPTDEDEFIFTEACGAILADEGASAEDREAAAFELGAFYYEHQRYDLARRYYELSDRLAESGGPAALGLGYIWYYGRTGTVDDQKALAYFTRAQGLPEARYKLADLYRAGRGVPRDLDEYERRIRALYRDLTEEGVGASCLPELSLRMGELEAAKGRTAEAFQLLLRAKNHLAFRMIEDRFFGNFTRMEEIVRQLYALPLPAGFPYDLYAVYHLLRQPGEVMLHLWDTCCPLEAMPVDGSCAIHFMGHWYRDCTEFLQKAQLDGIYLTRLYPQIELTPKEVG